MRLKYVMSVYTMLILTSSIAFSDQNPSADRQSVEDLILNRRAIHEQAPITSRNAATVPDDQYWTEISMLPGLCNPDSCNIYGDIYDLAEFGGELWAAGYLCECGGPSLTRAWWDGSSWYQADNDIGLGAQCLLATDSELYAAGVSYALSSVQAFDGNQWHGLDSIGYAEEIFRLAVYAGQIVALGRIHVTDTTVIQGIAELNNATWGSLGSPPFGAMQLLGGDIVVYENALIVAVDSAIYSWDGNSWTEFAGGSRCNGSFSALEIWNGNLVVAGSFDTLNETPVNSIAEWNGTSWQSLGSGITGETSQVWRLSQYRTQLIAAGWFGQAGGVSVQNIARWDGSQWLPLGSGIWGSATFAVSQYNDEIVFGGWGGIVFAWDKCCVGMRGNVDGDPNDVVDISDLIYFVDWSNSVGPPPSCMEEADVNGDGDVNSADLIYLVDYAMNDGPPPVSCD